MIKLLNREMAVDEATNLAMWVVSILKIKS